MGIMALIEKLPIAFAGPNVGLLPKLVDVDPRESSGMLFLPNAAWKTANTLTGTSSAASVGATFNVLNLSGTKGKVERTGKGGLHVITSPTAIANGDGAKIELDAAIRAYLYTNRTHTFYVSLWDRFTRKNPTVNPSHVQTGVMEFGAGSTSLDYTLALMTTSTHGPWSANSNGGGAGAGLNALGNSRKRTSGSGKSTMSVTSFGRVGPSWGQYAATYNAALPTQTLPNLTSSVFYELFIEDLTVSGRTYAAADELDAAEYAKAFAAEGRYGSDTIPTDPVTIA
jgi:hypothetical protein